MLDQHPERVDMRVLDGFEEYREFRGATSPASASSAGAPAAETVDGAVAAPEEVVQAAYEELSVALAEDLLERVLAASPAFFEQLVVDALLAMGYGGSRADAGQRLGRSGDGGIDG